MLSKIDCINISPSAYCSAGNWSQSHPRPNPGLCVCGGGGQKECENPRVARSCCEKMFS